MNVSDFKIFKSLVCPNALRITKGRVRSLDYVDSYAPQDPILLNYVHKGVNRDWSIREQTHEVIPGALELGPETWVSVPEDRWTIQPVSFDPFTCGYHVNFGTKVYNSYDEARENLWDTENLYIRDQMILCGWILLKGGGSLVKGLESPNIQVISADQTMRARLSLISSQDGDDPLDIEFLRSVFKDNQEYLGSRMTCYLKLSNAIVKLRGLLSAFIPSNYMGSFYRDVRVEKTDNFAGNSYFRISLDGVILFE